MIATKLDVVVTFHDIEVTFLQLATQFVTMDQKMTLTQFVNNNFIRVKFIPVQQCPSIPCCLRM